LAAHFTTVARLRRRRFLMRFSLGSVAAVTIGLLAAFALWPENRAIQGPAQVIGKTTLDAEPAGPPQVDVAQPVAREVVDYTDFAGRTEPSQAIQIRAQVSGTLEKVLFPAGAMVKKGDLLFEIDPRRAEAELTKAMAELNRAESHLKVAAATSTSMRRAAERNANAISASVLSHAHGDREEAEAQLQSVRASLEIAELNLSYTQLTAPINGRISRPIFDPGNLIKANETSLATLVSLDPMDVRFSVDETTFLRLRKAVREGQFEEAETPVSICLADEDDFHRRGKLESLGDQVDATYLTIPMRAVLANGDSDLIPGLRVRVRLVTSKPYNALLVPEAAIQTLEGHSYLLVVDEQNAIERRQVKVGRTEGKLRIIKEGLKPDEWVVISDRKNLRPDAKVEPKRINPTP
jgi:multidrug efflux system membrane fusion protein